MRRTVKIVWHLILPLLYFLVTLAPAYAVLYKEIEAKLPRLNPKKTRLFIYRGRHLGALMHPDLELNGKKIWETASGCVFYKDIDPARYVVTLAKNTESALTFYTYPGEVKYMVLGFAPGGLALTLVPELLDDVYGEANISDLDYCPDDLPKT